VLRKEIRNKHEAALDVLLFRQHLSILKLLQAPDLRAMASLDAIQSTTPLGLHQHQPAKRMHPHGSCFDTPFTKESKIKQTTVSAQRCYARACARTDSCRSQQGSPSGAFGSSIVIERRAPFPQTADPATTLISVHANTSVRQRITLSYPDIGPLQVPITMHLHVAVECISRIDPNRCLTMFIHCLQSS
jgi:hypothetical protein